MPVDPILRRFLDAVNAAPAPDPSLPIQELRRRANASLDSMFSTVAEPGPAVTSVTDEQVTVAGGTIAVRVYAPSADRPLPCHVFLHGGAFWHGDLDNATGRCRALAAGVGCMVVSVAYRLAPEFTYPVPVEDCFAALRWVHGGASRLGVDPARVSIGGASAGGALAAAVALMARDRGGPPLVFQLLDVPITDLTMSQPSVEENGHGGYLLTVDGIRRYVDLYLDDRGRATEPYASPLLAPDLTGLPPALVMTCEFDPLRDEGEAFGRRLREAGVAVTVRRWSGLVHGAGNFTRILPAARDYEQFAFAALRSALGTARVGEGARQA